MNTPSSPPPGSGGTQDPKTPEASYASCRPQDADLTEPATVDTIAAEWLLRSRQPDFSEQERKVLETWLAASSAHRQAYEGMQAMQARLRQLPRALLDPPPPQSARTARRTPVAFLPARRHALASMAVLGTIGATGGYVWHTQERALFQSRYLSAIGVQENITLPDGSALVLDSATRVSVSMHPHRRELVLEEGQIWLDVASDMDRPFTVKTPIMDIRVRGTHFTVRYSNTGMQPGVAEVAVASGRVRAFKPVPWWRSWIGSDTRGVALTTGMRATYGNNQPAILVSSVAPDSIGAWRNGRITFENTPLAQAVAEFDRYGATALRIADPRAAALKIGGSFDVQHLDDFVQILPQMLPVKLVYTPTTIEIHTR